VQLASLKLISICAYLTDVSVKWRPEDYRAHKMVKAIKGKPINGRFSSQVSGQWRTYNQVNVNEFVDRVPRALATNIRRHYDELATIVPIPNSHVVSAETEDFKTLEFAKRIAEHSGGKFTVVPALVFDKVQKKSHEGGPRSASHFEEAYRITQAVDGPIILLDDVCTGGGHLIGAHWRLHNEKMPIVLACTFGRSTNKQLENPVGLREDELDVTRR
jgi:hypothetical protein